MTTDGLDGTVALVTGAGRGLGRAEALELARGGARVVVNDFGTRLHGERDESPAEAVVEEIRALGGEAVADHGDVACFEDARAMVGRAVDTFGSLDILVNNAGILRDRMIFNMSEEEWDAVVRVHLKGHFCTSRWAAAYWRDRAKSTGEPVHGRVVNTSSEAFLSGSAGQPNYAAAKAGIVQLTLATSHALSRYGVTANAICPRALTRMTEQLQGFDAAEGEFQVFAPENVAPLVAYLASPAARRITGQVFVVYGRMITLLAGPSVEARFDVEDRWTPDAVSGQLTPFFAERDPTDGFAMRLSG
ncbi:MAG: 3-oxoacyl-ACP reductase [Acidimicrobiia bacterium]|nr:3-oxoacyl-ACP reductase [Acidimicrobiia bacterium]